ncbi:MAG TPA: nuclear transport factor 2 family protein [Steroidobacteraceae bacterium]|jgi:ketosteroid isomerase-like protein
MSSPLVRIQEPITGREQIDDVEQPLYALVQFYRALHSRDLVLIEQNWDASPEAAMDNPLGGIKRGWSEIRATYERLFASPWEYSFPFWDYTLHAAGAVFWVVGRERGRLTRGEQVIEVPIRTTRLFRRADGRWRQIHHHGSVEEPSVLARYLEAVSQAR